MSATMHLYEVVHGVHFVPGPFFELNPKDYDEVAKKSTAMFYEIIKQADEKFGKDYSEEKQTWIDTEFNKIDPMYLGEWSDKQNHYFFPIYKQTRKVIGSRNRRPQKYQNLAVKYFSNHIKTGPNDFYPIAKNYLVLDEIEYAQGWFFTKKLFNAKESTFCAFDKPTALSLLNRLVKRHGYDADRGIEAYNRFVDRIKQFKDNEHFILEISW